MFISLLYFFGDVSTITAAFIVISTILLLELKIAKNKSLLYGIFHDDISALGNLVFNIFLTYGFAIAIKYLFF